MRSLGRLAISRCELREDRPCCGADFGKISIVKERFIAVFPPCRADFGNIIGNVSLCSAPSEADRHTEHRRVLTSFPKVRTFWGTSRTEVRTLGRLHYHAEDRRCLPSSKKFPKFAPKQFLLDFQNESWFQMMFNGTQRHEETKLIGQSSISIGKATKLAATQSLCLLGMRNVSGGVITFVSSCLCVRFILPKLQCVKFILSEVEQMKKC